MAGDGRNGKWGQPPPAVHPAQPGSVLACSVKTMMRMKKTSRSKQLLHCALLTLAVFTLAGAGDPATRFNEIGHQLMCICSCNQILLECNHVACPPSHALPTQLIAPAPHAATNTLPH